MSISQNGAILVNIGFLETNFAFLGKKNFSSTGRCFRFQSLDPNDLRRLGRHSSAGALARGIVAEVIVDCSVAVIPMTLNPMLKVPKNPAKDRANTLPHSRRGRSCTAVVTSGSVIASR